MFEALAVMVGMVAASIGLLIVAAGPADRVIDTPVPTRPRRPLKPS
ncbi:hypothetical protein [Paludisphaera sp.]